MLKHRVLTALVMAAVVVGVLFFAPPVVFSVFLIAMTFVACLEWANLSSVTNVVLRAIYATVVSAVVAGFLFSSALYELLPLQSILLAAGVWWAVALLWIQSYPGSAIFWRPQPVRLIMGIFVLVPAVLALAHLYDQPRGDWLVISILLVVAAADSGAYFAGRAFGKRKLAPNVSPGKSWEGVVGGAISAVIVLNVFVLLLSEAHILTATILALPTAFISVVGDLLESMLKRHRGIKDSGKILPGHGGVLDRVDGLVAAAPIYALLMMGAEWQF